MPSSSVRLCKAVFAIAHPSAGCCIGFIALIFGALFILCYLKHEHKLPVLCDACVRSDPDEVEDAIN